MTEQVICFEQSLLNGVPINISHISAGEYKIPINAPNGEWSQGDHYFKWVLKSGVYTFTSNIHPYTIVNTPQS